MTEETRPLTKKERKAQRHAEKHATAHGRAQSPWISRLKWWGSIALVIALFVYWIYQGVVPIPPEAKDKPLNHAVASDWVQGNPTASVVVIEYSDLQCPACRAYYPMLKQLTAEYGDRVAFVYRHFPLRQIHFHADMAAQAAEAAGAQGKFWEMHDLLFEKQEEWAETSKASSLITGYAQGLSLNMDAFKKAWNSKLTKGLVKADYMSGLEYNIDATPTFFVNGEKIVNPNSTEAFAQILDSKLGSPSATPIQQ